MARFDRACAYLFGKGVADAQYNLGKMYFGGDGVPWSYEKVAELFRKASEQGTVLPDPCCCRWKTRI